MVIIGFGLYGHGPSNEQKNLGCQNKIDLGKKVILFETLWFSLSRRRFSSRLRRRFPLRLVRRRPSPSRPSPSLFVSSVAVLICFVRRRLRPSPSLVWYDRFRLSFWFNLFEMGLMGLLLIYIWDGFSGSSASLLLPLLLSAPTLDWTKELSVCRSVLLHH